MNRKGMPKALMYLVTGFVLYGLILYRTTNPTFTIFDGFTMPPVQYWVALGFIATIFIAAFTSVLYNKRKLSTFYLSRSIAFWLIQIPLMSMLSFFLIERSLSISIDNISTDWWLWVKTMLPPAFLMLTMITAITKNWTSEGGEDLARRFDTMGNTSMRVMSMALIVTFSTSLLITTIGPEQWIFITMLVIQWTATTTIYLRNGFKMVKQDYRNMFFGWVDPALPHSTLITILWWLITGLTMPWWEANLGVQNAYILVSTIGLTLQITLIGIHIVFKVSIFKVIIQDNPIYKHFNKALDKDDLKLEDLNPWEAIKEAIKFRRVHRLISKQKRHEHRNRKKDA